MEDYSEYLLQGEPHKCVRIRNWMAAIGLQDVDGLTPSNYMLETVRRNIEGEITIDEVSRLVDEYYTAQEGLKQEARTLEADKVSVRIAKLLSHQTFGLGPNYLAFFIIQYLKYLGFKVANEVFADNSKYFRNALVRANYSNIQYGIKETTEYLESFFRSLLMGEKNELKSRYMIIGTSWNELKSTQENFANIQQQ